VGKGESPLQWRPTKKEGEIRRGNAASWERNQGRKKSETELGRQSFRGHRKAVKGIWGVLLVGNGGGQGIPPDEKQLEGITFSRQAKGIPSFRKEGFVK